MYEKVDMHEVTKIKQNHERDNFESLQEGHILKHYLNSSMLEKPSKIQPFSFTVACSDVYLLNY